LGDNEDINNNGNDDNDDDNDDDNNDDNDDDNDDDDDDNDDDDDDDNDNVGDDAGSVAGRSRSQDGRANMRLYELGIAHRAMAKAGGGQWSGQRTQQPTIHESGEGEQRLAMRVL
jgi:hypothetical protein